MDKQSLKDIVQQLKKIVDVLESEVYSDPHAYEVWKSDGCLKQPMGYEDTDDDDGNPD
jgi:hypothetical protein